VAGHRYSDRGGFGGVELTEDHAEIALTVPGWPPTKNEATSMLAAYPLVLSLAPGAIQPVDYEAEHQCGFWSSMQ